MSSRDRRGLLVKVGVFVVLTLVAYFVVTTFVVQPFAVEQDSMRTTFEEGQRVLVDKLTPHFDGYSRGDIVVFNPVRRASCSDPTGVALPGGTPYIKRVIGEPGDRIQLRDGDVYLNGSVLVEPYVGDSGSGTGLSWDVAEGRLFVMGDNRPGSIDSRSDEIGQICINDVVGKAFLRYWPLDKLALLQPPTYSAGNP